MLKVANSVINASQIATPITFTGDVTLSTGNLVIGTSGKGIDFSVTSSGSGTMTSELLADYEEGTWTPNQGGGLTVVGAFSSSGTYTKVGRIVTIAGKVTGATSVACSAVGIITGNLPFSCNANTSTGGVLNATVASQGITFVNASSTNLFSTIIVTASTDMFFSAVYAV